jgi:hypothetical protein
VILKSSKGWQLIHPGGELEYIGDKVSDFDGEPVLSIVVSETQHQVRILTPVRMLVWDYRVNQWGEWTVSEGVHACMFGGAHVYLTATGTRAQLTAYTGLDYGLDVETVWIKPGNVLQGASRVRKVQPLGEHRSSHRLRLRLAYNYQQTDGGPTYVDDKTWTPSPAVVGGPLQLKHGPKRPQCQAIKVRLTALTDTVSVSADFQLNGQSFIVFTAGGVAGFWNAVLEAPRGYRLALRFFQADPQILGYPAIEVRDGQRFVGFTDVVNLLGPTWISEPGTTGILVIGTGGVVGDEESDRPVTVEQFEAAINTSHFVQVTRPSDASGGPGSGDPGSIPARLQMEANAGTERVLTISAGECLKLTSLALELGIEPGLYRRLPKEQQH